MNNGFAAEGTDAALCGGMRHDAARAGQLCPLRARLDCNARVHVLRARAHRTSRLCIRKPHVVCGSGERIGTLHVNGSSAHSRDGHWPKVFGQQFGFDAEVLENDQNEISFDFFMRRRLMRTNWGVRRLVERIASLVVRSALINIT